MKVRLILVAALAAMLALVGSGVASAAHVLWQQDFSTDTSDWMDSDDAWFGTVTHNAGAGTATMQGDAVTGLGPFSRFGGYRATWPGDYMAEIDVFLDPEWAAGTGFDYSVASSSSSGTHLRDFIFHVGVLADGRLLVNGSNNTDGTVNQFKLQNENGGNYVEVTEAGWYTLQHHFRDNAGVLAVDLSLLDADGAVLWTVTRSTPTDLIPSVVGGNRYAYFTVIRGSGIEVDNHELFLVTNDPIDNRDCKKGGWAEFGFSNQGRCLEFVKTGRDSR